MYESFSHLPGQVKERDEHPVVLHGFVGDLQNRDLIGFDPKLLTY